MSDDIFFDHESLVRVHDILWSWSTGYISSERAIEMLHLNEDEQLYKAAADFGIPYPNTALAISARLEMATRDLASEHRFGGPDAAGTEIDFLEEATKLNREAARRTTRSD